MRVMKCFGARQWQDLIHVPERFSGRSVRNAWRRKRWEGRERFRGSSWGALLPCHWDKAQTPAHRPRGASPDADPLLTRTPLSFPPIILASFVPRWHDAHSSLRAFALADGASWSTLAPKVHEAALAFHSQFHSNIISQRGLPWPPNPFFPSQSQAMATLYFITLGFFMVLTSI